MKAAVVTLLAISTRPPCLSAASLIRGDADSNGVREITDAIFILGFLFNGTRAPACTPIADSAGR